MLSSIVSIFILGILVIVHEAGHFVVARMAGVRVLRFSMGFGPRLFTWRRGHTEYAVSAIPLGGYVKMAGEQQEGRTHQPWEYLSKPVSIRALIVAAGPFVNYLVAVLSLWVVFIIGYPELLPIAGKVVPNMPAASVGLQPGDHIESIDGEALQTWDEMTAIIHRSPGQALRFGIRRQDHMLPIVITPLSKTVVDPLGHSTTVGQIGIQPNGEFRALKLPPVQAAVRAWQQHLAWLKQTFLALWSMLTGHLSMRDSVTGPIGIVMLTSEAVKLGISPVLFLISLFSLSLSVFNLFPIPILDGGHLLFLAIERLRGRPVSLAVQERSIQVGFALLLTLVVVVCANDLSRFGLFEKVAGWFHH